MDPALRRSAYRIMIVISLAMMTARICSAERVYEPSLDARPWPAERPFPMPTFGSNDRSRWATIRALVEDGTFAIGKRTQLPNGKYEDIGRVFEPGYESIDKVLEPTTNQFFSSKPPLLSVILAGEYWVLYRCGLTLDTHRWLVVRLIVWTANVLTLAIFLFLFVNVIERHGRTDWGRLFTMAAACFGTFLSTFAITLNNHIPAAVTAFMVVYPFLGNPARAWSPSRLLASGFFAGLTACFELPAAALLGGLGVGLLFRAPKLTLCIFLPAALLPIAAECALNYAAIAEFTPAYAKIGTEGGAWYDYPGSIWHKEAGEVQTGIDWAKDYETRGIYAFHLLLGHHGLFSLTPIWVLSAAFMIAVAGRSLGHFRYPERLYEHVLILTSLVTLAVIVFYAAVVGTRNYGGWTSCARWFIWLTPLWLIALLRAADRLANSCGGRAIALLVLAFSVFSANYPAWNPWRHPWLYNLLENLGMIPYGK